MLHQSINFGAPFLNKAANKEIVIPPYQQQ